MKQLLMLMVVLFCSTTAHAVITGIDYIKNKDLSVALLLYERHQGSQYDRVQMEGLKEFIEHYESSAREPLRIFTEVPGFVSYDLSTLLSPTPQKVTSSMPLIHDRLQMVSAENIEIRHVAITSQFLFDLPKNLLNFPHTAHYVFGTKAIPITCISVDDLTSEFLNNHLYLVNYFKQFPEFDQILLEKYISLDKSKELLNKIFAQHHIQPKMTCLNLAKKLSWQERCTLLSAIEDLFSDLFDLYILHKLLSCSQKNKIIIAGAGHARWIKETLVKIGSTVTPLCGDGRSTIVAKEDFLSLSKALI